MVKHQLPRLGLLALAASLIPAASAASIKERVDRMSPAPAASEINAAIPARAINHAPFKALSTAADGPTLYGWMSHNAAWDKNISTNYGIYSFPATANTSFSKLFATRNASAAANADGRLCAYYVLNYGGAVSIRYFMYDADNGQEKASATFGTSNTTDIYTQYAYTLAYNHADAKLYGEFFRAKNDDLAVCVSTIDPMTGKATEIAEIKSGSVLYVAMTFDNNGTLYAIGDDGNLYTISLSDGTPTLIGSTGLTPDQPQSAWFDPASNAIYWSYMGRSLESALYKINPATGATTLISDYPATTWMVGLYGDHTPTGKVPANVSDLTVNWVANASLDGTIAFTAPQKAADGSTLSGNLDVDLYVDYVKDASAPASVTPGATYTFSRSFTAGTHKIEAQLKNNAGYSDRARALVYAGTDRPGKVGNLEFTLTGRTANLSWTAPTTGENGGWFDPTGLSYNITRRPDNVVVAVGHTATSFSEEIPDELGNWFYEVTSVTATEGATAESNRILYGTAKAVPYKETFETEAPMDLFTIDDVNNDGYFWKWKDGTVVDVRGDAEDAADWIITPPIALTTEWIYKMSFDAHAFGTYYTESINAGVADAPKASSMKTIGSYTVNGETWKSFEALVEIDRNGNYHLGIQHATPAPSVNRDELYVDNISLVPFISTDAPASVRNLKIELLADNNLKGNLSFSAPATSINGKPISEISKIEIFRDGTLVKTESTVTINQDFNLEVDVPQGVHTFNVIAYNDKGRGHDTELQAFGGVDIPGIVNNLHYEWDPSDDRKATIKWDTPDRTGVNGYPLNTAELTYNVLSPLWGMLVTEKQGLTACEYPVSITSENQTLAQRAVQAASKGGNGTASMVYVNLGKPVSTPVYESFSGGAVNYPTWAISMLSGSASWSMSNDNAAIAQSQDGDNGFAACIITNGAQNGEGRLISPAFDFSATTPMYIHLWVYQTPANHPATTLTLEYTLNGADFRQLAEPIHLTGAPGWKEYTLPLSAIAGNHKAMLGFRANLPQADARVLMDNIVIDNDPTGAIDGTEADINGGVAIKGVNGAVEIIGAAGSTFSAVTPDGRTISTATLASGTETISLPAGIYIIKAGKAVAKVTVK